jgi:hypothetical protein
MTNGAELRAQNDYLASQLRALDKAPLSRRKKFHQSRNSLRGLR